MKDEHKSITLGKATELLEFDGDREGRALKKELEARELRLHVCIMTKWKRRHRTTTRVTLAAIRTHAPDLMPTKSDELLKEARSYLAAIDARIDDRVAEQISARVDPKIRRLEADRDKQAVAIRDLSKAVSRVVISR
jgi:hypothetical protein